MSAESIKVCVRFRYEPGVPDSEFANWEIDQDINEVRREQKKWTYDYLLSPDTDQAEMYEKVGKKTISDFLEGYNGTIFAYGQSGSGKTFSMLGPEDVTEALSKDFNSVPENVSKLYGITPRAVYQIYQAIDEFVSKGADCSLKASYFEIYNEQINCLLNQKQNLKIREHPLYGMYVSECEKVECKKPEAIFEVIAIATKNRAVGGTNQNARSSRSHTILLLDFEYNGLDGIKKNAKLNLVDLAGSERIAKTGAEGQRLKEAQKINQSLTTLGMCIMALTTANSKHIPFRNSKLTLILKESLGGSAKTTLLCTASRKKIHEEESIQTLYFASRAKSIKNVCKVNLTLGTKELQYLADHLKKEIMILRGQLKKAGVKWNKITDPKLLSFISNDLEGDEQANTDEAKQNQEIMKHVSRQSIMGLGEQDLINKYLDLHTKYDMLLENARAKIFRLESSGGKSGKAIPDFSKEEVSDFAENMNKITPDLKTGTINNEEIEKLNKIIEENKKKIEELTKDNTTLKNDNEIITNKVNEFIIELGEKEELFTLLKDDKNETDKEKNEIEAKYEALQNQKKLVDIEVESLKKEIETIKGSENNQSGLMDELTKKVNDLNEQIKNKDAEIINMKTAQQQDKLNYQKDIDSYISKQKVIETQIETLKEENNKLNKTLTDKAISQGLLKEKQKIDNESKEKLEKQINEILEENNKLKNEITKNQNMFSSEKSKIELQNNALKKEKELLITNNKTAEANYKNTIKELQDKINSYINKNEIMEKRVKELEENSITINNQLYELKNANEQVNTGKEELEQKIKEKDSIIGKGKKQIEELNNKIENIEKENKELKEKIEKLTKTQNNDNISSLKAEIQRLKSQIDSDKIKEKELYLQIDSLKRMKSQSSYGGEPQSPAMKTVSGSSKMSESEKTFGVKLKKARGGNDFLQSARDEYKKAQEEQRNLFKDNATYQELCQQIITLSPETVSSRSDMGDLPELDFTNEATFFEAEKEMLEKERIHQEKKAKEKAEKEKAEKLKLGLI